MVVSKTHQKMRQKLVQEDMSVGHKQHLRNLELWGKTDNLLRTSKSGQTSQNRGAGPKVGS